jgi:hypothetical protein
MGWHPSRGAAVKFQTGKPTVSVLLAGIGYLESQGITDKNKRNIAFYGFVTRRMPNYADFMRHPDDKGRVKD